MNPMLFRRRLLRTLPFGVIWLLGAVVFLAVEWSSHGGRFPVADGMISPDAAILAFAFAAMFLLGLLVGYVELNYFEPRFADHTFLRKSVYKLLIYFAFIHVVVLIAFPIAAAMEMHTSPFDPAVRDRLLSYLSSLTHLNTALQLTVIICLSIFYAQVSEMVGTTTLLSYLSGKYHQPIEEHRIYLFLDMRSSTSMTERLGHRRYFQLLKAYYADLAGAVADCSGELYLYVGDEMIITWPLREGLRDNACLRCFFHMQDDLAAKAAWYRENFCVVPSFKGGLHFGRVTTGEIGVAKKHIMFTGDVLNATSRIQSLCNLFEVDLLVSAALLDLLPLGSSFATSSVGEQTLRGKREAVELCTVRRTSPLTNHTRKQQRLPDSVPSGD